CVFNNDHIFASKRMDVTEPKGRKDLVSVLVNLEYCAEDQLGFDLSITMNDDGSVKELSSYDPETDTTLTYEVHALLSAATKNFGRHTRSFLCKKKPSQPGDPFIVVKDTWEKATLDEEGNEDLPESKTSNAA
ncbi:hypothetical protein EV175_007479, partial [Coemansia sp. RSA 1933]